MAIFSRRGVLGAGAAVGVLGLGSVLACNSRSEAQARLDRLDVLLPSIRRAESVGAEMRRLASQDDLLDQALIRPHIAQALAYDCDATRNQILTGGVRAEFNAGAVRLCDRFVLSDTECLVAALRA